MTMHSLSNSVLSFHPLASGEVLFQPGGVADHMFIVVCGELIYVKPGDYEQRGKIRKDDWIFEPCLWSEWDRLGSTWAIEECQLCQIDANAFGIIVLKDPIAWHLMSRYAFNYLEWV